MLTQFSSANVATLFQVVLFRYLIIASFAFFIFYILRKEAWRDKKIQHPFPVRSDYFREISYSVLTAFVFTGVGWLVFMTPVRICTQVYLKFSDHSTGYFLLTVTMMILIHDAYFYWTHRLMHHPAIYRTFHRVHHQSVNPSPWAAMSFHPLEALVEAGIIVLVAFLFPVHPFAIALFLLFMMLYNVYGHLGYELYPKGFAASRVGKWINTSVNHNQHHQYFRNNYGLYFLWWDRWMGTLSEDCEARFKEVKSCGRSDTKITI